MTKPMTKVREGSGTKGYERTVCNHSGAGGGVGGVRTKGIGSHEVDSSVRTLFFSVQA